ncbi:MAG TPA: ABC transporter ATP-binding protein [Bryobacteraceae bacterium]|nr:ABC transporter ATP-binding protein [Bryobacteraceae bacterium]
MNTANTAQTIVLDNVSKFYGEILGVNKVNLTIPPGITSLVGPNGSGKTTLMNLIAGLLQPTRGRVSVCGLSPGDPERFFRMAGYATQYDGFPRGLTGWQFVYCYLRLFGFSPADTERMAWEAIDRVGLRDAAGRKIAGYSKGMRQRIKLAQAIAHRPRVLVLDEPLNGLDPLARAETIALFRELGNEGSHVLISSHILHEVDLISDQVIMMSQGYVVAEGQIRGVRGEISEQPMQILIRCDKPEHLASRLFQQEQVVEAKVHADRGGLLVRTRHAESFYKLLNHIAINGIRIESVAPADEDAQSVYEYLIGSEESTK